MAAENRCFQEQHLSGMKIINFQYSPTGNPADVKPKTDWNDSILQSIPNWLRLLFVRVHNSGYLTAYSGGWCVTAEPLID